jgi:hypothetical protein
MIMDKIVAEDLIQAPADFFPCSKRWQRRARATLLVDRFAAHP